MKKHNNGQVHILSPFGSVYLYTHETGDDLLTTVHNVLSRRARWDDPDYLTRMVMCAMIPVEQWQEEKHFGIGTQLYVDTNILITLDTIHQRITVQSIDNKYDKFTMKFEEFVTDFFKQAQI